MGPDLSPLQERFGPVAEIRACASTQGRVWRVRLRDCTVAVKVLIEREREALRRLEGLPVPRILAELPGLLVLSWIDGETEPTSLGAYEAAGRLLRRIHAVPIDDDDPVPVADALLARVEAWTRRATGTLPAGVIERVRRSADATRYEGCGRVLCHRDYSSRNWIVDSGGELHAIDFGQARPDLAAWDLVKVVAAAEPAAREAFLAGYGDALDLEPLVGLHGLQTAVWGIEHADPHLQALGRRILERVGR